jgi:hypothetical protein
MQAASHLYHFDRLMMLHFCGWGLILPCVVLNELALLGVQMETIGGFISLIPA